MNLFEAVMQAKSRAAVVQAVRQWFNALPRPDIAITPQEHRADLFHRTAGANRHWLAELVVSAETDPDIWEGLRRYALDEATAGKPVAPDLAIVLLTGAPKRKKGRQTGMKPFDERLMMHYARAVWCVYHGSEKRYTLATNSPNPDNAYTMVAEATNECFETVRNAARGQLKRLDAIARHADSHTHLKGRLFIGRCE